MGSRPGLHFVQSIQELLFRPHHIHHNGLGLAGVGPPPHLLRPHPGAPMNASLRGVLGWGDPSLGAAIRAAPGVRG